MNVSPKTQKSLEEWIASEAWHDEHAADQKRYYRFVTNFAADCKSLPQILDIEALIRQAVQQRHPSHPILKKTLKNRIEKLSADVATIVGYLLYK